MQIPDLSISGLRRIYRAGEVAPADVIAAIYDRIEAASLKPVWITLIPREAALARLAGMSSDLPLFGVPFAVKDNIDVVGYPTTAGCPAFAYMPDQDAFVVQRLQQAGAILIGKTNLDQFATGLVGTRSPHGACSSVFDQRYISGGSSSGSAVAVAGGLVSFSLGTDTAGSGRVPAAFNNIVGLKPSRGLVSASGVVPACRSVDCVSIFALSCSDAQAVFGVACELDLNDPFARSYPANPPQLGNAQLRIGVPHDDQLEFFGDLEYQRLFRETISHLAAAGHFIAEVDLSPFRAAAELLYAGPYVAERFAAVGEFVKAHLSDVDPVVGSIVTAAEKWTAADAYQALYKLEALKKKTDSIWPKMDVLLLPTTPTTYKIEEVTADPVRLNSRLGYYTNFVNLLDYAAVAVPAGSTTAGLPFGVTVIGPKFTDQALLGFANSLHQICSVKEDTILLSVVGAHLSGQPLNHQLLERGAKLVRTTRTAADYQFFALTNTTPAKPGLIRVLGFQGPGIETEIYAMPASKFGSFVALVPPPLAIGSCILEDGSTVKGFVCEPYATAGMPDITKLGSWRAYLASLTGK